jgi:hypothetical protein
MEATTTFDVRLQSLLQPLLSVRHPHLQPLESVTTSPRTVSMVYGEPGPCRPDCDGVAGAVHALHTAGLWVGDMLAAIGMDSRGRVVLSGVGTSWSLADPFARHPATRGQEDLRIAWRQRADLAALSQMPSELLACG